MAPAQQSSLEEATRFTPAGDGLAMVELSPAWWLEGTAYGGYLAAALLRAMLERGGTLRGTQRPLSMTVHFHSRVRPGPARVRVTATYEGRTTSTLTARLEQDGSCAAFAVASVGRAAQGPALAERPMPVSDPPEACPPLVVRPEVRERFPLHARFERRRLPEHARTAFDTGGWIRLSEPRPLDHLTAVTLLDSWVAAATTKVTARRMLTLVYVVQFLEDLPPAGDDGAGFSLVTFRSQWAKDGYAEDDGELWSRDGILLARAHQVVLIGD
jgi:acyl-CoA thioesterase